VHLNHSAQGNPNTDNYARQRVTPPRRGGQSQTKSPQKMTRLRGTGKLRGRFRYMVVPYKFRTPSLHLFPINSNYISPLFPYQITLIHIQYLVVKSSSALPTAACINFDWCSQFIHHRSHRDRKERYIRNLEQELQRLREAYTAAMREKVPIMEENRQLHAILKQHGIAFPYPSQIQEQIIVPAGNIPATAQGIAQLQLDHHHGHDYSQHEHDHSHHAHLYPPPPQIDLSVSGGQGTGLGGQQITPEQYSQIAINLVLGYEVTYTSLSRRQIANMRTTPAWKNPARTICKNSLLYPTRIPITFKGMSSWLAAHLNHTLRPTQIKIGV